MGRVVRLKLCEMLVEKKVINRQQLEEALRAQKENGGRLGENLARLGYATEEDIAACLATQYGIPYLPLSNVTIDPEITKTIPADIARRDLIIPIDKIGQTLTVAMADPLNYLAIENLKHITGCHIEIVVSTETDVCEALKTYYGPSHSSPEEEKVEDEDEEEMVPQVKEKLKPPMGSTTDEKEILKRLDKIEKKVDEMWLLFWRNKEGKA